MSELLAMVITSESTDPLTDIADFSDIVDGFCEQGGEGDLGTVLTARLIELGIPPTVGSSIVATVLPLTLVSEIIENEEGAEDEQFVEATWVIACNDTHSPGLQSALSQAFPSLTFSFGEDYFGDLLPEQ